MRNAAINVSRWSAIGLGFFIPISVALDNVLLLLTLLGWLLAGDLTKRLREIRSHPVARAALLFAAVMALGMTWSLQPLGAQKESLVELLRFLVLAVLVTVFAHEPTRSRAKTAFLASSTLILAMSYLLSSGILPALPGIKGDAEYPVIFKYHITHNVLMALAAVMFMLRAFDSTSRRRALYAVLTAAIVFNIFFMIPGRTGQLAFAAAVLYVAFTRLRWLGVGAAVACLAAIVGTAWLLPNSILHQRVELAVAEASAWRPDQAQPKNSSIGLRLEFYRNSLAMIAERPVLGTGTGSFSKAYEGQVAGTNMAVASQPHNAYLLIATELGALGLAVLFVLLVVQWRTAARLPQPSDIVTARAFLVVFVVTGMVSSTFNDHVEGLFFAWASALLWSALPARPRT